MNKIIKYGVVAGLTMAAFSVAGAPVYADEPAPEPVCTVTAGTTAYTWTYSNCTVKTDESGVEAEITGPGITGIKTLTNLDDGNTGTIAINTADYAAGEFHVKFYIEDYYTPSAENLSFTVTASIEKTGANTLTYVHQDDATVEVGIKNSNDSYTALTAGTDYTWTKNDKVAGSGTIVLSLDKSTLADGTYTLAVFFDDNNTMTGDYEETFVVANTLTEVNATITGNAIATTYNEGYERTPALGYAVEDDYKDIVTVAADGTISVADTYKTATAKDVVITVTATDGEIVKTTTVTYTIAANYTAVEAGFEDDKDTITVSGDTTIVISKVDGVEYEYDYDKNYLDIDESGNVTVKEGTLLEKNTEFLITVKATAGDEEIKPAELTLKVEKNYTSSYDEPIFTIIGGEKIEAGEPVVVEIDAPMSKLWGIMVFNKTLLEKAQNGEELTEEELEAIAYQLGEDDCEVTEGSTIITLSDAFLAKLPAGDYLLRAYFYDDSNAEDVREGYAESTFTVAATAPDTGAATAVKAGATSSVLASVLAAITAAGAAVVAKFAKRK